MYLTKGTKEEKICPNCNGRGQFEVRAINNLYCIDNIIVCKVCNGRGVTEKVTMILQISGPFTGTGDGRIVELELALSEYERLNSCGQLVGLLPDTILIPAKDINAFYKEVIQPTWSFYPYPIASSSPGCLVSAYRFKGKVIRVEVYEDLTTEEPVIKKEKTYEEDAPRSISLREDY